MEGAAKSIEKTIKARNVPSRTSAATHEAASSVQQTASRFAAIQQTAGNLAIQRLFDSDSLQSQFVISQPEMVRRQGDAFLGTKEKPSNPSPFVPEQVTDAANASVPQAKKGNESLSVLEETGFNESAAGEAPAGKEIPKEAAAPEEAPASPEEDPQYQVVVEELEIKAEHQKTPAKKPEQKQAETVLAAKAVTKGLTNTRYARENHLRKIALVQPDDLTVPQFMTKFGVAIKKLAATVPTNNSDEQRAVFDSGQETAKQDVASQGKSHSQPLRDEMANDPSTYRDNEKEEATDYKLEPDPPGNRPGIKQARAAAPKPEPEKVLSLDDKSRELDEALQNHDVGGQKINIDEGSLAFPVSGEKSFDEAGETKRQAQAEIAKARPKYRQEEKGVIGKSQNDIDSLVNVQGLLGHHRLRSEGFKNVLGAQERHKTGIVSVKQKFSNRVEEIYKDTKEKVDEAVNSLTEGYTIEEDLEEILSDAESYFKTWTRQALEYIYPGFWGRSTWIDKNQERILQEYKRLAGEKYRDLDEAIEGLSKKSKTLGELAKAFKGLGGGDFQLYLKALKTVQDQSSLEYYQTAKEEFIYTVQTKVEQRIARRVVNAVNRARRAIVKGNEDVDAAYHELKPKDQKEVDDVYNAVKNRFADLRQTVDERQHEIIGDMARTYNKSVSKLKATFDEIKKDVLTSWLEKAWNKLKAVVNAIVEFAKRIAQLVGRIVGLVGEIVSSPRYFFNNLVTGIGQGFSTFVNRIDEFLATAFFDWLRGSSGVMVQLPKEWNPKGIFSLFTQLLNLSTETVWQRMEVVYDKTVANAFRRGEALLDKGLEIFAIIKNEGLGGLWDHIVESLGSLLSDTLATMKETVLYAAIKKVIFEIGKMLVPGGGFIAIAEKVIRLVQFLVEARNKILDLIESFVASMENAVKGDIPGIVKLITGALTKFITVALDFLVTFFGLGNLKEKVERLIERMRSPIIRGIDWVLGKFKPLVMKGKELFEKGKEKVTAAGKAVVQVGLPQDPNERLKLGIQTAVRVVDALSGRAITQKVIAPALAGVRIRYGFTTLRPFVKDGIWWIEGTINPTLIGPTHQPASAQSASQQELELLVKRIAPSYPVDGLDRPKGPSGHILEIKTAGEREAMTSKFMRGYQPRDQRGHLIGDRFHGPAEPSNLVPMHPTLNLSTYKSHENTIATKALTLTNNNRPVLVFMTATPKYPVDDEADDASFRPSSVTISARISTLRLGVSPVTLEEENLSSPPLANPPAEVTSVAINGDIEELKAALRVLAAPRLQNSRNVRRLVDAVLLARKQRGPGGRAREGNFKDHGDFRYRTAQALGPDFIELLEAVRDYEITI